MLIPMILEMYTYIYIYLDCLAPPLSYSWLRPWSWCLHSSSSTHSSSQPGGISPGHTSTKALRGTTDYSKAEYTNTQQDLPVGDNYFTNSRHDRLLATEVSFAEKQQRICSHPKLAGLIRSVRPVGPTGQTGVVKVHEILFGLHHWIGLDE
jgi:hypothetical protein